MFDVNAGIIVIISFLPLLVLQFTGSFVSFALLALIAIVIHGTYLFGPQILLLLLITFAVSTIAELISLKTPFGIFGATYKYNIYHRFFLPVYFLWACIRWKLPSRG